MTQSEQPHGQGPTIEHEQAEGAAREGERAAAAAPVKTPVADPADGPVSPAVAEADVAAPEPEAEDINIDATDAQALEGDVDELVTLAAQRDDYLALAQRTQADFENYRKRVARDTAVAQERGVAKLTKELLPALDNLDRALEAAEQNDPLLEGVRLVRSELSAALARVGIESFAPVGEVFDPAEHEAMVQQPVEGAASGTVAEVYQPGYRLGATVIRPARVLVAA
jgi:molecular chaperone GrpE